MEEQIIRCVQTQEANGIDDVFTLVFQKAPIVSPLHYKAQVGIDLQSIVNQLVLESNRDKVKVFVNDREETDLTYTPIKTDIVIVSTTPEGLGALIVGVLISAVVGYFLFKPKIPNFTQPDISENKQLARIQGARNEARIYDTIPVVLGKRQVVPAYQAMPYTEIRGQDEWFKMLLCVGFGPLKIENIRIGDTPIGQYEHRIAVLDHYQNRSTAALRAIWPEDISQEQVGVTLAFEGNRDIVNRTTATNIDRVSVDFFYPRGIVQIDSNTGDERSRTVVVMHEYQDPSDNQWVAVCPVGRVPSGATPFKVENGIAHIKGFGGLVSSVVRTGSSARQLRSNITYTVPNVSTPINIRSRKVSPQDTPDDSKLSDEVEWSVIRSIRNTNEQQFLNLIGDAVPPIYINAQPVKVFKPVIIALEIKATDQLNGMLDNLNVDATSVVPSNWNLDWRDWYNLALKPTENPAECYRWMMQGPMNAGAIANERIDLEGLEVWRNRCTADGWKISSLIDYESTLFKELGQIAFTGRAEFGFVDGRYGVVEKIARYTPVQVFTPKNSRNFVSSRNYPDPVDGIRFNWDNKDKDYQKDEDYFYDITLPTNERTGQFDTIDFWGVSDHDLAYKHARFAYYEGKLRREVYKLSTDIEGMVCTRGDLVRIQNDIIDIGLGSGRIKEIEGNRIFIDEIEGLPTDLAGTVFWDNATILFSSEEVLWNEGQDIISYGFQIRCSTGEIVTISAIYIGDNTWRTSDQIPPCASVGDLIVYGEVGRETLDCIVDQIEYGEDLTCTITLLNAANEIYERDDDFIPEFESGLTERPNYVTPEPPIFAINVAGFDISRAVMYVGVGGVADINQVTGYQLFVNLVDNDPESEIDWVVYEIPQGASQFIVPNISRGQTYQLKARTIGINRTFSPFTDISTVEVPVGLPAQDITGVGFNHTKDGTILTWDEATDQDFQYYELRTNTNFGNETGLVRKTTSNRFNVGYLLGSNTFYVAAKTRFGVYSRLGTQINVSSPVVGTPTDLVVGLVRDTTQVSWAASATSDYTLSEYVIRRNTPQTGTGFANAVLVGTTMATFFNLPSEDSGSFVYWVSAVDSAGNESLPVSNEVEITFPDTPSGLTTEGLFRNVQVKWNQPTYFGHDYTEVWRAGVNDIAQSFKVGETKNDYFVDITEGDTTYFYWIRNVSVTGTVGLWSGFSEVTTPDTGFITAEELIGRLGYEQFDSESGVFPIRLVDTLPLLPDSLYPLNTIVSLTPDGTLYRNVDGAWSAEIDGTLITDNSIQSDSITAGAITAGKIATGAVVADNIAANAIVAGKIAADAVLGENIFAGTRIQIGNLDGVSDYVVMDNGSLETYKYIAGEHRLHKQLTRRESGVAASGSTVTLEGYWEEAPDIQVSPNTVVTYDPIYNNQRQTWSCRVEGLTSPTEGVWRFTAVANLVLGDASGSTPINITQETSANTYTSPEYTSPANTDSMEIHVSLKSVRGTGTAPNYYHRRIRWRVGYSSTQGGPYTYTAYRTRNMGTSLTYVPDNVLVDPIGSGVWYFIIEYIAEDAGGTFSTGATQYEYDTQVRSNTGTETVNLLSFNTSGPYTSQTKTLTLPNYTPASGWQITSVDYNYEYAFYLQSTSSGSNSVASFGIKEGDGVSDLFNYPVYQRARWGEIKGVSGLTNWTSRSRTKSIYQTNFLEFTGAINQSAQTDISVRNITATISLRKPIANSTTPDNGYRFDYYDYNLTTAEIISEGVLNWIAVGT